MPLLGNENDLKRLMVEESYEIDLFGDISKVILELTQIKERYSDKRYLSVIISKVWTGYEDCHEEYVVTRMESDEEYKGRLNRIKETKEKKIRQDNEEKQALIQEKLKLIDDLNKNIESIKKTISSEIGD